MNKDFLLGFGAGKAQGGSGPSITVESLTANQNGEYNPGEGKAFSPVTVMVPNTYSAGDEGKVVSSGALVTQTPHAKVTENGTIDTTFNNSVEIDVSGGTFVEPPEKDVNFIDYDGTLLYSYTAQEAAALTEMPANPSHPGLTAQGWNYTLAEMKAEITAQGACDIGQMYVTDDGKTRVYITIPEDTYGEALVFQLRFLQTIANDVVVNWGDGSAPETFSGTSASDRSHTYPGPGDYVITLSLTSGYIDFTGSNSETIYGPTSTANEYNRSRIKKIEFGARVRQLGQYIFNNCICLETITMPNGLTNASSYNNMFKSCYSLKALVFPTGFTRIGTSAFSTNCDLKKVSIPKTVVSIGDETFRYCYNLERIVIPSSITSIGLKAFNACYSLKKAILSENVSVLYSQCFSTCYMLLKVKIPAKVTNMSDAFTSCSSLNEIRFENTSSAPHAGSSFITSNSPYLVRIYVPFSALASYLSATNYPSKELYTYVGFATYLSGASLPTQDSTQAYNVVWYATKQDAINQTNPITQGNGNEIYCRWTSVVT